MKNKKIKGSNSPTFRELYERIQRESPPDHEWTLEEINAEINAARQERSRNVVTISNTKDPEVKH